MLEVFGLRGSCKSGDGLVVRHVSANRDNLKGYFLRLFEAVHRNQRIESNLLVVCSLVHKHFLVFCCVLHI